MTTKTIRDLETWIAEYGEQITQAQDVVNDLTKKRDGMVLALGIACEKEDTDTVEALPGKDLRNEIYAVLEEAGSPLHYGEIYDRLKGRSIPIAGKDPKRNVNAHLSGDDRFARVGGGSWGLRRWQEPRNTIHTDGQPSRAPITSLRDRVRAQTAILDVRVDNLDNEAVPF